MTRTFISLAPPKGILKILLATLSNIAFTLYISSLLEWFWKDSWSSHVLLQSPEHIGFLWSLTKLLTAWLWKEEFSPVSRIVCFCLAVQKAHPGREPHAEHRPKLSTHCRFTNGDRQVDGWARPGLRISKGWIFTVLLLVFLTSRFFSLCSRLTTGVDTTFPPNSFKHRQLLGCCSMLFFRSKKKIVRWKLLFSSTGLLFNSASSQGDLEFWPLPRLRVLALQLCATAPDFYVVLGIEPRVLCIAAKHTPVGTASPAFQTHSTPSRFCGSPCTLTDVIRWGCSGKREKRLHLCRRIVTNKQGAFVILIGSSWQKFHTAVSLGHWQLFMVSNFCGL